jgi:hypothetical protein
MFCAQPPKVRLAAAKNPRTIRRCGARPATQDTDDPPFRATAWLFAPCGKYPFTSFDEISIACQNGIYHSFMQG